MSNVDRDEGGPRLYADMAAAVVVQKMVCVKAFGDGEVECEALGLFQKVHGICFEAIAYQPERQDEGALS